VVDSRPLAGWGPSTDFSTTVEKTVEIKHFSGLDTVKHGKYRGSVEAKAE
jgi:hypothetical protein